MPMNGKTDEEIVKEFKSIKKRVLELFDGCQVIDSVFSNFDLDNNANTPIHYLGRSIELLADADVVYFAKGWEKARGCLIEYQVAKTYGKTYVEEPKQEPKEPLIKEEKIRKAVRAWAEANEIVKAFVVMNKNMNWIIYGDDIDRNRFMIEFFDRVVFENDETKNYSIEELCGESEDDANMSL